MNRNRALIGLFTTSLTLTATIAPVRAECGPPEVAWAKSIDYTADDGPGGESGSEWTNMMAVDGAGRVFVTGRQLDESGTTHDFVTFALDTEGDLLWSVSEPGEVGGDDRAVAIAVDSDGRVFVAGRSAAPSLHTRFTVVAYDASNGSQLWSRAIEGADGESARANDLAVVGGRVYVTGQAWDGSNYSWLTVAYDQDGGELWRRSKQGSEASAIAIGEEGQVLVTGTSWSPATGTDILTVSYDPDGDELWSRTRHFGMSDTATVLAAGPEGRVYVAGRSSSGAPNFEDYLVVAYDGGGNELWVRMKNGSSESSETLRSITLGTTGVLFVTGSSNSPVTQKSNILTVAYDSSGEELWANSRFAEGGETAVAWAAVPALGGGVYVSGAGDGQLGPGNAYVALSVLYDVSGNEIWAHQPGMTSASTKVSVAGARSPIGGLVVSGWSSTYVNPGFDQNFEVARIVGCEAPMFADGFELGDSSRWSSEGE